MHVASRKKIVLLGMMSRMPFAGVIWQTMHYLVGFARLGYEAYYVEAHACTPTKLMQHRSDDSSAMAARFIAKLATQFDFEDRWAFHALHDDGRCYGMSYEQLLVLYSEAHLIINLHGGTRPLPEHSKTGRLVYLETDPVQLQIELQNQNQDTIEFLEPHFAFFTFGENYGRPDCKLPVSDRFTFIPTRQPVVLDFWEQHVESDRGVFSTIGNWRQLSREVRLEGETYGWSKHREFGKFMELPSVTGAKFELALGSYTRDDQAELERNGWSVRNAPAFTMDADAYRSYIRESRGEFTVAKDQNVRLRSGWFSDRSATYLAAGRPVITQDTAFGNILPVGQGLFPFTTIEDAAAAVEAVQSDHRRHCSAAAEIARTYFDAEKVLSQMLNAIAA